MKYKFGKDEICLFRPRNMEDIEKSVEEIFIANKDILPSRKNAKILIKPNFNNDLNAITGNSTDLRIIISVLKCLKKRKYTDITIGEGPNCGVNHIGIDVFSRLGIDKIAKLFKVKLVNFNKADGKAITLLTGKAEVAKICTNADFLINIPKIKTHVEAKISVACKNLMGCFKGTEKRKMHDNLPGNIIKLNEIIKTNLIIVDGLVCMEGRGPGDGIPKKIGVILSGHNPFLMDFLCSKLMGLDYTQMPFLMEAIKNRHISESDEETLRRIEKIAVFKSGDKTLFDRILLNNFFIGIRFSKIFEKFFNKGIIPWILFKMRVKQDKYVFDEIDLKLQEKTGLSEKQKERLKECLKVYCPLKCSPEDKQCIQCMYCYQISPGLLNYTGKLGAFEMQLERFGKYVRDN